jgi:hypothetical protein
MLNPRSSVSASLMQGERVQQNVKDSHLAVVANTSVSEGLKRTDTIESAPHVKLFVGSDLPFQMTTETNLCSLHLFGHISTKSWSYNSLLKTVLVMFPCRKQGNCLLKEMGLPNNFPTKIRAGYIHWVSVQAGGQHSWQVKKTSDHFTSQKGRLEGREKGLKDLKMLHLLWSQTSTWDPPVTKIEEFQWWSTDLQAQLPTKKLRLDKERSSHAIGDENKVKVNFSKTLQTTEKQVGSWTT